MSYSTLVETLVKGVVEDPSAVEIEETVEGHTRTFFVRVADNDIGKVIGKSGRVVSAIRSVVSAVASRDRERAFVKILPE
ncbi:MAG: KH domain-containing protein [Fimbriimonadaceae bacterium]|nr:hypothetical protein [Fimbriimonadaceae bacterium]QOJ12586.1 MAG: KH domain-containing protein [Chthonomonadaceae bacterium]RIK01244.1 MAG: RNA-binding protein [Armatimonadota bacterium]MCL4284816.1 KH domain-containing protein [Fimbriimonadaceae bacterium]MCZ7580755.1 KH domain-containing protein [Fimbriimonadaceae bacterium]